MSDRIPLLIDTDPGVDDALALLMAFNDQRHDVIGLTIAAGNVGLGHTVRNALKLCEISGRTDIPVFAGAPEPLLHPAPDAGYVHGQDGFGDIGYDAPAKQAETEHAALAILRLSHEHAGKLLLVALGPLTNIALALKLDPTLPQRIARFVVMGGAVTGHGNITPAAEFNFYFDPEAAHLVFEAFDRIELADWEATIAHGLHHDRVVGWLRADSDRPGSMPASRKRPGCGRSTAGATTGMPPTPWRWRSRWPRKARWNGPSARWPSSCRASTAGAPAWWTGAARAAGRTRPTSCCATTRTVSRP